MLPKVCIICGRDCTAMRRAKDSRGHYTCGECLDQAAHAKAAREATLERRKNQEPKPPPPPDEVNNDIIFEQAPLPPGHVACPACRKPMPKEAVVCVNCGWNDERGRREITRIKR